MRDRLEATLTLERPASSVKFVSPSRERILSSWGVETVRDILELYPFRYIDLSLTATVAKATPGVNCTIAGSIYRIESKRTRRRSLSLTEITVVDETGTLMVSCFNQPWLTRQYSEGDRVAVAGKLEFNYGFKRMTNPHIEKLEADEAAQGRVIPVYHAAAKLKTGQVAAIVREALNYVRGCEDPLPLELRRKYRLMSRGSALQCIHEPQNMARVHAARRRLAYEELLLLELQLKMRSLKRSLQHEPASHIIGGLYVAAVEAALPFSLTDEQRQARDELFREMAATRPANHLLLGDVGTGKTAVALFGLAAVADTGMQAMMMAPTEVLAQQYAQSLGSILDTVGISWGLLTGSTPAEERARIVKDAAAGELVVLFGTHALLEPDVVMPRLSFVVIDEQQRFGVAQREALVAKGDCPDILSLTATPIPRSLALAVYGDMTLSYLRQRPRNAAGVRTRVFDRDAAFEAYGIAVEALKKGDQVFVVCPLVGAAPAQSDEGEAAGGPYARENDDEHLAFEAVAIESDADFEASDIHAVETHTRALKRNVFADWRVGVLHGQLSSEKKREVMDDFRAHRIDVLVATTVIEVGVDVPNATVMVIEDADRFGLAQLHQLRGRVGRGDKPGEVCLISGSRAPLAIKRLTAMESIQDGFELSEYDLSLRREGDILGNRQHGTSGLKLVNIMRDRAMIEAAHADAGEMLAGDPELQEECHQALRREVRRLDRGEEVSR